MIDASASGNQLRMLFALTISVLTQLPACELPPWKTGITMRQPLRLPDGSEFGLLVPLSCPSNWAQVISAGTINQQGVAEASFQSGGFTVKSVFSPEWLFTTRGVPVRNASLTASPEACHDLALMPEAELPNSDGNAFPIFRADIDDRWVQCGKRIDLYVQHGVPDRTPSVREPTQSIGRVGRHIYFLPPPREPVTPPPAERTALVGSVEPGTAIIPMIERDGWTQVSPFDPVPFQLSDGWTWWVRTSALQGCRQPR